MDYIYRFVYVEPTLHPWDEAYLIVIDNLFDVLLHPVCQYFIEYFASMFIIDIDLKFSFYVVSVPGFLYQDDAGLIKLVREESHFFYCSQ